jgi:hypothetical protein
MNQKLANFVNNILPQFPQKFPLSCAANAMDAILRFEGLFDNHKPGFQDREKNQNIGYERLGEITELRFLQHNCDCVELRDLLRTETDNDRLVLVSVHQGFFTPFKALQATPQKSVVQSHIWLGMHFNGDAMLISPSMVNGKMLRLKAGSLKMIFDEACQIDPNYRFDCRSYVRV